MWNFKQDIFKTENVSEVIINVPKFDYMVVRFLWHFPTDGKDLDIFVGYRNTGTIYDVGTSTIQTLVGFGQKNSIGVKSNVIPSTATTTNAYLWWAADDTNGATNNVTPDDGVEAVVIGIRSFITGQTTSNNFIDVSLNAVWYENKIKNGGHVTLELSTYTGGTMQIAGTNIINVSGTTAGPTFSAMTTVPNFSNSANILNSKHIATLRYDILADTGQLIIV